jgi:hypothetical protein
MLLINSLLQTMALTAARARAVALVARPVVGRVAASQSRGLAGTFEDRERGEESVYFRRTVSLAYSFICMRSTVVHTSKHNAAYPTHTKDSNVPQTCSAGPWCCCTRKCLECLSRCSHCCFVGTSVTAHRSVNNWRSC